MTFNFVETTPVKRAGHGGSGPKDSPFEAPVKAAAASGKAQGFVYTLPTGPDARTAEVEIRSLTGKIQAMGVRCSPPVTVNVSTSDKLPDGKAVGKGKVFVTFWTTKKIVRKTKPADAGK